MIFTACGVSRTEFYRIVGGPALRLVACILGFRIVCVTRIWRSLAKLSLDRGDDSLDTEGLWVSDGCAGSFLNVVNG